MVGNRIPNGLKWIGFDRLSWKKSVPTDPEIFPLPSVVKRFLPKRKEDRSKVEFRVEEGVVEIHDRRLFRDGQGPFCLAFVEEMVRPEVAQRIEIRSAPATCRIEFEPGRYNRDTLATKVASALKTASLRSKEQPCDPSIDRHPSPWVTLTAVKSSDGPKIWETLVDLDGQVIIQPRSTLVASKISEHSKRPLRTPPRRARLNPPRARAAGLCATRRPVELEVEPIALALAARSIFGSHLSTLSRLDPPESKRVVHLALAGGSFAMAVAGVVLPGIPALPFLLLTGHYLVRSSPELCRQLDHVPGIGRLLRKAEEAGNQPIDRRSLWKMLGFTVAALAAFVILHPPLPVVILLEAGIMVYYGFREFQKPARTAIGSDFRAPIACLA